MKASVCSWWSGTLFLVLLALLAMGIGCGGGEPQKTANPAEAKYAEVEKAMADVKFEKAISLTSEIISKYTDSEFAEKARVLRTILLAGVSAGYGKMAEIYIEGTGKARKDSGQFRATAWDYYRKQRAGALAFYESADYCLKNYSETHQCIIQIKFPDQDIVTNHSLELVRRGNLVDSEKRLGGEEDEMRNGVITMLTLFLGHGIDRALARKDLESGSHRLEHSEYFATISSQLLANQKLFARAALNEPGRAQAYFKKAVEMHAFTEKLLKAKPNKDVQKEADKVKADIEALKKKGMKVS
jgi:hypothetical protein